MGLSGVEWGYVGWSEVEWVEWGGGRVGRRWSGVTWGYVGLSGVGRRWSRVTWG